LLKSMTNLLLLMKSLSLLPPPQCLRLLWKEWTNDHDLNECD
jgi:hypothetical protein